MLSIHWCCALILGCVVHICDGSPKTGGCLKCIAIQDAIRKSIIRNITIQKRAFPNETPEIDDWEVIKDVCKSQSWKECEYSNEVRKGCSRFVEDHHRTISQFWHTSNNVNRYKDKSMTRWSMFSVCTQPKIDTCGPGEGGMFGEEVSNSRCDICRAITKDIFRITRWSKHVPKSDKAEGYADLVYYADQVCDELFQWRSLRQGEEDDYGRRGEAEEKIIQECKILYKDYKFYFAKLLIHMDPVGASTRARNMCNGVGLCQFEIARLPFAQDGKNKDPLAKDEV
mmetsp:Transcript_69953/g.116172  ORF Transcript_69953/g.116172 Transcript_69953/m.116172 type:complete len:284 (-) Transcript_69953:206-1057(-)